MGGLNMGKGKLLLFLAILIIVEVLGVQVSVENREILAVDELHVTSSNPDILRINNGLFVLEVLPNRGRIIWRLHPLCDEREEMIFSSEDPYILPFLDEVTSQYVFELGGFYISIPWNPRSNQPYPYEKYEIIEADNEARIILRGMNPVEKLNTTIELVIKDNNPRIFINVIVQNVSESEVVISVKEFTNFHLSDGVITTDFPDLNGRSLEDFEEYELITLENDLEFFGVSRGKYVLKKILTDTYSRHYVQIWGKNWQECVGGSPSVRLTDERFKETLSPNEQYSFEIIFELVSW